MSFPFITVVSTTRHLYAPTASILIAARPTFQQTLMRQGMLLEQGGTRSRKDLQVMLESLNRAYRALISTVSSSPYREAMEASIHMG